MKTGIILILIGIACMLTGIGFLLGIFLIVLGFFGFVIGFVKGGAKLAIKGVGKSINNNKEIKK